MFDKALREVIATPLDTSFLIICHDYPYPYTVWHYHPEYEIHLIRKTAGSFYVGTYAGLFEPGNLVMTGPNLPHMWVTTAAGPDKEAATGIIRDRDVALQFSGEFAQSCLQSFSDCAGLQDLLDDSVAGLEFSPEISREGAVLLEAILKAQGLERIALFFRLTALLASDTERRSLSMAPPRSQDSAADDLKAVLEYIAEHCSRSDLTCGEIARANGMTPSALSHLFERNTRCTCIEYLNRLRVYHACQKLAETDEPVTAIGYDVGYSVLSTFNRNFTRYIGMAPSEFRQQRGLKKSA
ncbi:AraC family transcriptional regulator [Consotaella aegiceratis]|uniref:AraC family transcriptional regulator n=1 Tax=Consotaella aegiceratis TaxID=3097961 RepID=UPI002F3E6FE6